ncbi:MAG: response regulator [Planctomycetota bacterium]
MSKIRPKLLLVDDEERVTQGLRVILRRDFDVATANSGAEGLKQLAESGPFAVVVSDMRMPKMNGAEFLAYAKTLAPMTARVLLTGQADQDDAIAAVNEGGIFRFLTKPCPSGPLRQALGEAREFHELMVAEKELLEGTLRSSIELLTDILGLVHPIVAGYQVRTRAIVAHVVERLSPPAPWRYELSAMLSLLGCLTLPKGLMNRAYLGAELSEEEECAVAGHPALGARLIEGTPRLEEVAEIVARQSTPATEEERQGPPQDWDPVVLGGELLRLAADYLRGCGGTRGAATKLAQEHAPELLEALKGVVVPEPEDAVLVVPASKLVRGMRLVEDLVSDDGVVLAASGTTVNLTLIKLVENFAARGSVPDEIQVRVARGATEEEAA